MNKYRLIAGDVSRASYVLPPAQSASRIELPLRPSPNPKVSGTASVNSFESAVLCCACFESGESSVRLPGEPHEYWGVGGDGRVNNPLPVLVLRAIHAATPVFPQEVRCHLHVHALFPESRNYRSLGPAHEPFSLEITSMLSTRSSPISDWCAGSPQKSMCRALAQPGAVVLVGQQCPERKRDDHDADDYCAKQRSAIGGEAQHGGRHE